jgi:hypothetical protein
MYTSIGFANFMQSIIQYYFSHIVAASFIGGGIQSTRKELSIYSETEERWSFKTGGILKEVQFI